MRCQLYSLHYPHTISRKGFILYYPVRRCSYGLYGITIFTEASNSLISCDYYDTYSE